MGPAEDEKHTAHTFFPFLIPLEFIKSLANLCSLSNCILERRIWTKKIPECKEVERRETLMKWNYHLPLQQHQRRKCKVAMCKPHMCILYILYAYRRAIVFLVCVFTILHTCTLHQWRWQHTGILTMKNTMRTPSKHLSIFGAAKCDMKNDY